jgi:N-methylhydantoinase A
VALVLGGVPAMTTHGKVAGRDVALPMLDINTVSAGGGTLATVDAQGALHLGPESAGAVPGPVCYGRGGVIPSVTDADVVLGYLNPVALLGGSLPIDAAAAGRAIRERVAEPLGVDLYRAATGIVRVVNVAMAEAIKAISTHRGHDIRGFTLVPFGGAGPVHACQIAVDLGIREVLVPRLPGVFSAQGLMLSTVKHDHVRSRLEPILELDEATVSDRFAAIRLEADAGLADDGFAPVDRELRCRLEMRYAGQGYELAVPIERLPLGPGDLARCRDAFDELHRRQHGHAAPDQPVEVVNYRVEAIGLVPGVTVPDPPPASEPVESAQVGERPVLFPTLADEPRAVPVYDRARLLPGHAFPGPAIVEQYDATTVICPEQDVTVDARGNLVVRLRAMPA